MTQLAGPHDDDPWDKLIDRGGIHALPLPTPDAWPHGALPKSDKSRVVGADSLSAQYCTIQGHRFLCAHLLLPIRGARTVLGTC